MRSPVRGSGHSDVQVSRRGQAQRVGAAVVDNLDAVEVTVFDEEEDVDRRFGATHAALDGNCVHDLGSRRGRFSFQIAEHQSQRARGAY